MGIIAAVVPVGIATLLTASSPALAFTLAVSGLGAGAIIGATIGRSLATRPDPLAVLMVAAIADVVGCLLAIPAVLLLDRSGDVPLAFMLVFAVPAYFFLAFPGVILGIVIARWLTPSRA